MVFSWLSGAHLSLGESRTDDCPTCDYACRCGNCTPILVDTVRFGVWGWVRRVSRNGYLRIGGAGIHKDGTNMGTTARFHDAVVGRVSRVVVVNPHDFASGWPLLVPESVRERGAEVKFISHLVRAAMDHAVQRLLSTRRVKVVSQISS